MYIAAGHALYSFLWPTLVVLALSTPGDQSAGMQEESPSIGPWMSRNPSPPVNPTGAPSSSVLALQSASPSLPVQVMVELEEAPTAEVYAREKNRTNALGEAASESLAGNAAQRQLRANETAQQTLLRALMDPAIDSHILFRVQRVYNGIALEVDSSKLKQIAELPGVKSIHPLPLAELARSFSVPFIGAPAVWSGSGLNVTGRDIKVGIIDSGIDYLHKDFGGSGNYTGQIYTDAVIPWTAKVVGGFDFAGDDYEPSSTDPVKRSPRPDPDPMDCNGHGTSTAGIVAGYGIRRDGTTYNGPFNRSIDYSALSIGPGVAPEARLYALKVGGCQGSSRVIPQAIEWAADPNGDGDFSDHLDVLNISMGAPWGSVDDPNARALNNAGLVGVLSAAAAGNDGDSYYVVSSPSVASHAISVAGSETGNAFVDGFRINAPASLQGVYPSTNSANFNWQSLPGPLSGNLVYPAGTGQNTGCSAINASNAALLNGNIALLDYTGDCGTSTSVGNAAQAGARGVLLIHNQPNWRGITGSSQIPATRTTQAIGNLIKQALAAGATVQVTLTTEYNSAHKIEDKGRLDMVVDYSSRGPRGGDSFLKPDITAPTEYVQTAQAKSGSGVTGFNGTSCSAPHIAGGLALMRQLRPGWTVEEIKAALMNTAAHDLFSQPSLTPPRYSPARVGAGRVDLAKAADTAILAFNADDPGMVSVSFGAPEVTDTMVLEKSIRVVNKGPTPASFTVGYDGISDTPGVDFSFPGGSTVEAGAGRYRIVEIAPGQSKVFTVRMTANAAQMKHSRDATVSATQAGYARHWISEEAGYITLSPANGRQLRIPVYAAPRPASTMRGNLDQITLAAPTGTIPIPLAGQGVNTGNSPPTDVVSLVGAFELQESSPDDAHSTGLLQSLDLKNIGVRSNIKAMAAQGKGMADTTLHFALSTYQDWSTQTPYYFYVYLDTNRDGIDDYYLYNGGYATTNDGVADAPYSKLCTAAGANCKFEGWLNYYDASQRETVVFNTNIMWLMVKAADLGLTESKSSFNYRVEIKYWGSGSPLTWLTIDSSNVLTYDAARPGLDFSNGAADRFLFSDAAGETIPMAYNRADFLAAGSKGVLLLHHHNTKGTRDQVIRITDSASGTAGTIRGSLDAPANDATLSGTVDVLGWSAVVAGNVAGPAARVELFVDGIFGTRLAVGASRPDVAQFLAGQGITSPPNLGYKGQWNSQSVYDGAHLLTVRATDASGTVQEASSEIGRITVRTVNNITPTTRPPITSTTTSTTFAATTTTTGATSTTLPGSVYRRYFPRMINDSAQTTSLAVVNLSSLSAGLNFKAYSNTGSLLASSQRALPPLNQFAQLVSEIFPSLGTISGWFLMESTAPSVEGFFLFFDFNLTVMDGAGVSGSLLRDFVLPATDDGELNFANPLNSSARSTLEYFTEAGRSPFLTPVSVTIPAMGRTTLPVSSIRPNWAKGGYIRAQGDGIIPTEVIGKPGWIAVINGIDLAATTTSASKEAVSTAMLYAPQYISGGGFASVLDIINLESSTMPLLLKLYGDNGTQMGSTGSISIPPLGSIRIDSPSIFGLAAGSALLQGYVQIQHPDPRFTGRFNGWIRFTDEAETKFGTTLQLVETGLTNTCFSQVAQDDLFFTGLAALNPNSQTATVDITVFNTNGVYVATGRRDIPPGGRFSKLLPELVGSFPPMTKGYFRMTSTLPVAGFALFGTWNGEVLSAIPPQSPSAK